jgi:hypothetical protein
MGQEQEAVTWRLPGFAAIYWSHFRSLGQFWPLATGLSTHSRNSILMNLEQESNTHYVWRTLGMVHITVYTLKLFNS